MVLNYYNHQFWERHWPSHFKTFTLQHKAKRNLESDPSYHLLKKAQKTVPLIAWETSLPNNWCKHTHTSWSAKLNMIAKSFAIMLTLFFFWTFPRETFPVKNATQQRWSMRKPMSCKKTAESPGCSSFTDWPEIFLWLIRNRQFKCFWNWFGKSKHPEALLNLLQL